ncbi:MAG: DEAD/DEAH box helicase [Dehalococcoidia bacterium]
MDSAQFLSHLRSLPLYQGQIVHVEDIPPREIRPEELERPLPPQVEAVLRERDLLPLYSHQVQALNALRQGEHVVVATPSASGKSLIYNLAALETLSTERGSTALYLFPTKALAQDQWRGLRELATPHFLGEEEAGAYDGDTPQQERGLIRRRARVVFTNPDMLHVGILPNHAAWGRFLRRLRLVVVDEAHTYRGALGSHVALVLRRLRRLCAAYGSHPRFVLCSATLANPGELAHKLVGLPCQTVTDDGSPSGGKDFVLWDPPLLDRGRTGRRSANTEAATLLSELLRWGVRSLTFARTRKLTELIYLYCRDALLAKGDLDLAQRLRPYRAGYLPEVRREIESQLFRGELLGVVATNALELGIDIGTLDATVLTGYPGSIASTYQQAGRSGRRGERSLSILVGLDNPLDQYFMRHPQALFGQPVEHALLNPANPHILRPHLLCAAYELPLSGNEQDLFGPEMVQLVKELEQAGLLRQQRGRWYPSATLSYPAQGVNLRSASERAYSIVDTSQGRLLETVEAAVAFLQVHPGAIYLHQGESYIVTDLDVANRVAYAQPTDVDYYTQPHDLTDIRIIKVTAEKAAGRSRAILGEVEVTLRVIGFRRKQQLTEEVIGEESLDLPPYTFTTTALWFHTPAPPAIERQGLDFPGGLHALEHAAIGLLPLFALCDRQDIGGVSTPAHPDTGGPEVFIYDGYPGGVGIAEKGYELMEELWRATLGLVRDCPCEAGCPSCVQSPKCGNNNQPLDKQAARLLLQALLGWEG